MLSKKPLCAVLGRGVECFILRGRQEMHLVKCSQFVLWGKSSCHWAKKFGYGTPSMDAWMSKVKTILCKQHLTCSCILYARMQPHYFWWNFKRTVAILALGFTWTLWLCSAHNSVHWVGVLRNRAAALAMVFLGLNLHLFRSLWALLWSAFCQGLERCAQCHSVALLCPDSYKGI